MADLRGAAEIVLLFGERAGTSCERASELHWALISGNEFSDRAQIESA
jgi:hypothetical protein